MFVSDFKKIQKKAINYPSVVTVYKWDKKTKKLKKDTVDWDVEVAKNKHVELKELLKRNLLPNSDKPLSYADVAFAKDISIDKVYNAAASIYVEKAQDQVANNKKDLKKNDHQKEVKKDDQQVEDKK